MKNLWKIILSDGTQIKNLKLSGNNFISEKEITKDIFKGNLSKIIIEGEEDGQKIRNECEHVELVQIAHYEDGYYFILRELSQQELKEIKMQGDIEYLAMMSDIDLEEV